MESLVGVAVFMIIAVSIYQAYIVTLNAIRVSHFKTITTALANEQFEIIRNLAYADVGIVDSVPLGKIPRTQILVRDDTEFTVVTTIRNIDDPFDGTIGGNPNDLSPADYKFVEIEISCFFCKNFQPFQFTTWVAPKALETMSTNGALFVRVFDASGQLVANADIHIENNQAAPPFVIDDTTNNDGILQIVDVLPGVEVYEITVSKSGYSTEHTYQTGALENPNPTKPHATVVNQQLTQISFTIDHTSTLDISSVRNTCNAVPSIDFLLQGSKIIGTDPDILKYSASHTTDSIGQKTITALEWDTYNSTITNSAYDLAGTIPLLPLALDPNANQNFKFVVALKDPQSLLVIVKDASSRLPLQGVQVKMEHNGNETTLITGHGFIRQTEWQGGGGQDDFIDSSKYFNSDGNVEINNPAGELHLKKSFDEYALSANIISSTFDIGTLGNFHRIFWFPENQPPETGLDGIYFKIATNNNKETWNFFGPDGTGSTYYTLADQDINPLHNENRYFRYQLFMQTASTTWSPTISDISFTFTSSCVPPGQAFFTNLNLVEYTLTVSKTGYQLFSDTITISSPWQKQEVVLLPE